MLLVRRFARWCGSGTLSVPFDEVNSGQEAPCPGHGRTIPGDAMAGRDRRGRAWGELQAQTQQARELAEFLRRLVDQHGFTVRRLQEVMSYGKSTISSHAMGTRQLIAR